MSMQSKLPNTHKLLLIGLILLIAAGMIVLAACLFANHDTFVENALMEEDFSRLSEESYESVLLSMHSTAHFREEDFALFRGQDTVVTSHTLKDTKELSRYLDCILNSGNSVSNLYLCLDPELLWKNVGEKKQKWESSLANGLYTYIKSHPQISFEVLLPYPYIKYWLDLEEESFDTLLTVYHTLVYELSAYPNTKVFFPGVEEWLMINPDNYTDLPFDANEVITNKLFLYTFCDSAYQITPINEDFFWNALRETVTREKNTPTYYPDLSEWCLVFMGDSVLGNFPGSFSIPGYVSGLSGAHVYNYAVGGTSAASRGDTMDLPNIFSDFLTENVKETENGNLFAPGGAEVLGDKRLCFILNYGFNDYFSGVPIENPQNLYDISCYKGSLRACISTLQIFFPDACYIIMTPTHTALFHNGTDVTSEKGDVLSAYVEAARELAAEMELYFLDNYNNSVVTQETLEDYLSDGTHPNERGRLALAAQLMYFMENEVQ